MPILFENILYYTCQNCFNSINKKDNYLEIHYYKGCVYNLQLCSELCFKKMIHTYPYLNKHTFIWI